MSLLLCTSQHSGVVAERLRPLHQRCILARIESLISGQNPEISTRRLDRVDPGIRQSGLAAESLRPEVVHMTIENEDEYQQAVAKLKLLADAPDGERDEGAFLDLSAAMVAYETSVAAPAEE